MPNALRFRQSQVGRQNGEQARLRVVQGPDFGSIFVIFANRVVLGRGDENDVVLGDLKASRRHAEVLKPAPQGDWELRDLGGANGLIHNGRPSKGTKLRSGDTFTLGETTLEFLGQEVQTQFLSAPVKSLGQSAPVGFVPGLLPGTVSAPPVRSPSAQANGGPKRLLILAAGAAAFYFFFLGDDAPTKPKTKKKEEVRDLASYLPPQEAGSVNATAEMFFKSGFREFSAGNFLRAKTQFETVLQIMPGHPQATLYLQNSVKAIEDEVDFHLVQGKRGYESGKIKTARAHYETVLRLLFRDTENPKYIEAKKQLETIQDDAKKGAAG